MPKTLQNALFQDTAPPARTLLFHTLDDLQHRLIDWCGPPPPRQVWDPLTHLVYSILSSRTKDAESIATMQALRERYDGWPTGPSSWDEVRWERLRDAPVADIEHALRLVTFPERKAPQLKAALEHITQRAGALSLAFLARYRTDKIRRWVEQLPGAGEKASAAVVNFSSLRRAALAIDAHHQRIAIRLGVVAASATTRQVEVALMQLAPAAWTPVTLDEHHTLVKQLGQRICTLREPQCRQCPLLQICLTGQGALPMTPIQPSV